MGDVAHSRTLTILVSRTPMYGHSENQPRNRDQSHVFTSRQISSWLPIYSCCSLVTMALRFGHKSSGSSSFRGGLISAGFHGFQSIQAVTLSSRHKLRLFLIAERASCLAVSIFTRDEVQLIVHVSRSLSDICVWVVPWSSSHHHYLSCGCSLPAGA